MNRMGRGPSPSAQDDKACGGSDRGVRGRWGGGVATTGSRWLQGRAGRGPSPSAQDDNGMRWFGPGRAWSLRRRGSLRRSRGGCRNVWGEVLRLRLRMTMACGGVGPGRAWSLRRCGSLRRSRGGCMNRMGRGPSPLAQDDNDMRSCGSGRARSLRRWGRNDGLVVVAGTVRGGVLRLRLRMTMTCGRMDRGERGR